MENGSEIITWEVLEYPERERSVDWFWGFGLVAIIGIIVSIIFSNFLLAIILALGAFTLGTFARRSPSLLQVELSAKGVKFGSTFYPYKNLKSFWVTETPGKEKLLLESERTLMPIIDIDLGPINRDRVMNFLKRYLEVKEHEESFLDAIGDWFGL